MSEKIWILFFYAILSIWITTIGTTTYYMITGDEILIDTDVNLFYITLPFLFLILLYTSVSLFIFIVYLFTDKKVKSMQKKAFEKSLKNTDGPKGLCSVIIASHNEDTVIRNTVQECLKQTYENFEVVIVCHNCSDRTLDEANVNDPRVKALDYKSKESGKGVALTFGVKESQGEYILILDADGILSRDFIEKALPLLKDYAAVQGRYIPSNRNYSFVSRLLSLEGDLWSTPYMTARTFLDKRGGLGGTGYVIKKDILLKVGGFKNHLVDDYELTSRLLKDKHRIVFAPLCINYDEKPPNLDIMLRQRARWAKGFVDLLRCRAFELTDILGFIFWISPVAIFAGLGLLLTVGFGMIFNLLLGYFPFNYASITINQWLLLTGIIWSTQACVLVKQYGLSGLKYSLYLPIYNAFILYVMVAFVRALGIKSWGSTKTTHGFAKKNPN